MLRGWDMLRSHQRLRFVSVTVAIQVAHAITDIIPISMVAYPTNDIPPNDIAYAITDHAPHNVAHTDPDPDSNPYRVTHASRDPVSDASTDITPNRGFLATPDPVAIASFDWVLHANTRPVAPARVVRRGGLGGWSYAVGCARANVCSIEEALRGSEHKHPRVFRISVHEGVVLEYDGGAGGDIRGPQYSELCVDVGNREGLGCVRFVVHSAGVVRGVQNWDTGTGDGAFGHSPLMSYHIYRLPCSFATCIGKSNFIRPCFTPALTSLLVMFFLKG